MKGLLVIDMQEEYIGSSKNKKKFPYQPDTLISDINKKIADYPKKAVIYITNRFFWGLSKKPKCLVKGLHVVSANIFEKRKGDSFSNPDLSSYLQDVEADEVELVGADGNNCV